jgi:Arc/MetJ-type ribon-helix-helix transcriptional regulator
MKTIALKLPDELLTKIEHAANKRGKTRSAVMREALEDFLADNRNLAGGSCLDLARDLAGCVQAPEDLSTNPTHMDDYGK